MSKEKSKKSHSSNNLKVSTRLTISTVMSIVIPVLVLLIFSSVIMYNAASVFNFTTVTTNSYSMLNQVQWSQTISSIGDELISSDTDSHKKEMLSEFTSPLESLGSMIYIEHNGKEFYSSKNAKGIIEAARSIVEIKNNGENINYFGENGLVIVSHAKKDKDTYTILIVNRTYSVKGATSKSSRQNFYSMIIGRTGILFLVIALIFVLSIILLSCITSRTITKPLKELSEGANEIANGNLDHTIDYESTNEIGTTVSAFNDMARQLKKSIDTQNSIEESRQQVINGVAHDLRTPLTSIKGYVEGIRDGIANTPEKQERYLQTIYSSALDMEKLLDELLSLSRLETGNIELNMEPINIVAFLRDYAEETAFQLEKSGFKLKYELPNDADIEVMLDCDRFVRVLSNIVSNSVKYAKKNIAGEILLSLENYKKSVIISIKDNGIGIDQKNLAHIFETFYRADTARTRVREGSGIGLSVCKQIVELHDGQIWAFSEPDRGTTIFISLNKIEHNENERGE